MARFHRKRIYFTITAMELHVAAAFAAVPAAKHVQEFHLIPLFSRTRMRVRSGTPERVAHCHKSRIFSMQLSGFPMTEGNHAWV